MKKIVTIRLPADTLRTFRANVAMHKLATCDSLSLSDYACACASYVADTITEDKMKSFKAWTKEQPMDQRAPITLSVPASIQEELKQYSKEINVPVLCYYWFGLRYYQTAHEKKDKNALALIHKLAEEMSEE